MVGGDGGRVRKEGGRAVDGGRWPDVWTVDDGRVLAQLHRAGDVVWRGEGEGSEGRSVVSLAQCGGAGAWRVVWRGWVGWWGEGRQ